jgi:hypothetical protein
MHVFQPRLCTETMTNAGCIGRYLMAGLLTAYLLCLSGCCAGCKPSGTGDASKCTDAPECCSGACSSGSCSKCGGLCGHALCLCLHTTGTNFSRLPSNNRSTRLTRLVSLVSNISSHTIIGHVASMRVIYVLASMEFVLYFTQHIAEHSYGPPCRFQPAWGTHTPSPSPTPVERACLHLAAPTICAEWHQAAGKIC